MGSEDSAELPLGEGPGHKNTCIVKGRPQRCGQSRDCWSHLEGLNSGASLQTGKGGRMEEIGRRQSPTGLEV